MEHTTADELDVLSAPRSRRVSDESSTEQGVALGNEATTRLLTSADAGAVMRRAPRSQGAGPLDPDIAADIQSARGGGSALDEGVRNDMEGQFGVDFSNVRVHADSRGDQLSRSVEAEAFTTGTDVFFRSGRYQPDSSDGRKLLAHELTHVVQQSSGRVGGAGEVSHPDDAHEAEARDVADTVSAAPVAAGADRQPAEEIDGTDAAAVDRNPREEEEDDTSQVAPVDRAEAPAEDELEDESE